MEMKDGYYRYEKSTNETEFISYQAKLSLTDADYRADIRAQLNRYV